MNKMLSIGNDMFEFFLPEKKIRSAVKRIARQINTDYKGKTPVFIGILNGSFIFLADLLRCIKTDCEVDFLKISSYGNTRKSSGRIHLQKDLDSDIKGRDVIIVEDIVDSGLSTDFIKKHILARKPASARIVSLILKRSTLKNNIKIDYIGFEIPDIFVIGYGLDYAQTARNLKDIYRSKKD